MRYLTFIFMLCSLTLVAQSSLIQGTIVPDTGKNIIYLEIDNGVDSVLFLFQKSFDGREYEDFYIFIPHTDGKRKYLSVTDEHPKVVTFYRIYEILPTDQVYAREPIRMYNINAIKEENNYRTLKRI